MRDAASTGLGKQQSEITKGVVDSSHRLKYPALGGWSACCKGSFASPCFPLLVPHMFIFNIGTPNVSIGTLFFPNFDLPSWG